MKYRNKGCAFNLYSCFPVKECWIDPPISLKRSWWPLSSCSSIIRSLICSSTWPVYIRWHTLMFMYLMTRQMSESKCSNICQHLSSPSVVSLCLCAAFSINRLLDIRRFALHAHIMDFHKRLYKLCSATAKQAVDLVFGAAFTLTLTWHTEKSGETYTWRVLPWIIIEDHSNLFSH